MADYQGNLTGAQIDAIPGNINLLQQGKVDKVEGKGLSANDYTTEEKNKLSGISAGATVGATSAQATEIAKIANKVDKVTGKGLSTNDYTTAEKQKLASTVMKVNNTSPDANGNINVNTLTDAEYTALNAAVQTVEGSAAKLTELENGKADSASVFPTFDTTKAYTYGDKVGYNGKLYKFTSSKDAGAWDATKVALAKDICSDLEENYVQKSDYAPNLTSGMALGLVGKGTATSMLVGTGGRTVSDTIEKGVSAKVTKIEGRSVAWKQMVNISSKASFTTQGVTYTNNNDGTWTLNGTSSGVSTPGLGLEPVSYIEGHKYLLGGSCNGVYLYQEGEAFTQPLYSRNGGVGIGVCAKNATSSIWSYLNRDILFDNAIVRPYLLDLTLTFGTTVANTITNSIDAARLLGFDSWQKYTESDQFATDMQYSANGVLIPTRPQALKSEGVTATGETFSISRDLSDAIAQCFPDGMKKAGSVSDSIEVENGVVKAVKKLGAVKLKDLTWEKNGSYTQYYATNVSNKIKKPSTLYVVSNINCNKYNSISRADAETTIGISVSVSGNVTIFDTNHNTLDSFVSSLKDSDLLYYELATPITTELPATSLDLALLSGGGTLTLVPQSGQRTAPINVSMSVSRDYVSLEEKNAKALGTWDSNQAKAYVLIDGEKHYIQIDND